MRDGLLTIDSAIETVRRGSGHPELRDAPTKTANVRRAVALDADTLALIEGVRVVREPYGQWMFGLGPELVNPDRIGWWWRRSWALAGIDAKWRLHDLRHWSATVAIGQGHDIRTVAGRLGHANPAMTLRVYAHAVRRQPTRLSRRASAPLLEATDRRSPSDRAPWSDPKHRLTWPWSWCEAVQWPRPERSARARGTPGGCSDVPRVAHWWRSAST